MTTIVAEFPIPATELALEVIVKGEKATDIFEILDREPERANMAVRRIIEDEIKHERIDDVCVKEISFNHTDSNNITHAVCYFTVKLEGMEENLRKLAGQDKLFYYEWEK